MRSVMTFDRSYGWMTEKTSPDSDLYSGLDELLGGVRSSVRDGGAPRHQQEQRAISGPNAHLRVPHTHHAGTTNR